jgi:hypothetical protein
MFRIANDTLLGESHLGYATSDGSVCVIKITQSINEGPSGTDLRMVVESSPRILYQPDRMGITALSWIEIPRKGVSLSPYVTQIHNEYRLSAFLCTANLEFFISGVARLNHLDGQGIAPSDCQLSSYQQAPRHSIPLQDFNTYNGRTCSFSRFMMARST